MRSKFFIILSILISSSILAQEKKYVETEIDIPVNSATIKGTLLKPTVSKKVPLVILIPGSGPTDRNGNNSMMTNNSLKFLAEKLADNTIATYRYDKSVLSFTKDDLKKIDSLKFENFINEAKSVIQYFKNSNNFSKIIVAGHSQGSLVGMVASENNSNINAYISLEGAGRPIDEILIEQIGKQAPLLKDETVRVLDSLKKGKTVANFNTMLNSLFKKSVQPFIISWIRYNPQKEIKKLNIPILIINGTNDIQVGTIDAELLQKANPASKLVYIENMNHIFKEIKGDNNENIKSYNNPNLPVMPELVLKITDFINELK